MKFIDQVPRFALEDEDSCGDASSGVSKGGITFICQTCLDFEFGFWFAGSKPSLVKIGESTFPTLFLKCVLLIKTR